VATNTVVTVPVAVVAVLLAVTTLMAMVVTAAAMVVTAVAMVVTAAAMLVTAVAMVVTAAAILGDRSKYIERKSLAFHTNICSKKISVYVTGRVVPGYNFHMQFNSCFFHYLILKFRENLCKKQKLLDWIHRGCAAY
jgi:hypothetical protein